MNGLVKFALGLANVPDSMVLEIERAIPGAQRLIEAAKKLEPAIARLAPLVDQAMPIIMTDVMPVIKTEYPDLMALLPLAGEVLTFVKGSATSPGGKV